MRVFMTGATGAIGSRALPLLIEAGHEVTAIGRSPRKRLVLQSAGACPVAVVPDWGTARIDAAEQARRLESARKRMDDLRKRDPSGDLEL